MKSTLFFMLTVFGFYAFGQQKQFQGIVYDSIGNPVNKAEICKLDKQNFGEYTCVTSDRWGKYRISLTNGSLILVEIKYDSIPNIKKYFEYSEDPFDGSASLTEIKRIKDDLVWKNKTDSTVFSINYPIEKESLKKHYPSKIEIIRDSARLLNDPDFVKGKLGFDLNFTYSISEHLKTPELQNRFVQGRPDNGVYTHFGPPEAFSWGPSFSEAGGLTEFDPNRIFRKANGFKTGFNAAYERNGNYWNFNFVNQSDEGLLKPVKSNSNQFKFNYNFPAWDGVMKTTVSVTFNKDEMPLVGNNYMNVLYAAWNTPFHFDTSQLLSNGVQNSASGMYNNPDFLLRYNKDLRKENQYNFGANYSVDLGKWDLKGDLSFNYYNQKLNYGQIPNMVQTDSSQFFHRNFDQFLTSVNWRAEYENRINYDQKIGIQLDWMYQLEMAELNKTRFEGYTSLDNFPGNSLSANMYDVNKIRNSSVLSAKLKYDSYLDEIGIKNDLIQSLLYTSTNEQSLAYQIGNRFLLESNYLLRDFNFDFGINYEMTYSEPGLIHQNLNFNALNQSLNDFVTYSEPYELILNKNLKNLQEKRLTEVGLKIGVDQIFSLWMKYFYGKYKDAYAPVFKDNAFVWENVADYHQQGFDITLSKDYYFLHSKNFNWDLELNFHAYKNKTDRILNGQSRVPFFGFNEVSKNYIEGQPVGVIVGSDYLRNEAGQILIGDDGFPLVDNNLKVIADPNPDFTMNWFNSIRVHNFSLSFNFEWQKGGQIWNGTQNTLNYFGRSQLTADMRDVSGFVFDGVNAAGQPNTIPVDFSNPASDLSENRWVRYGLTGVASDAVESASYLRLQNISLNYETKLKRFHYSTITQFSIGVFARNLWVSSRYKGVFPGNGLLGNPTGAGMDYYNFPLSRVYGVSVNLKF